MNPQFEECSEWIRKGNNDLLSARILLKNEKPVTETACFHCQQAVEKMLKTYLVLKGVRFERIHNLAYWGLSAWRFAKYSFRDTVIRNS